MIDENSTEEYFIEAIQQNPDALQYACIELTKANPNALQFASDELKSDKDVVLAALGLAKEDGYSLEFVPDYLRKDKNFRKFVNELKKGVNND